jgi:hypothetical protein
MGKKKELLLPSPSSDFTITRRISALSDFLSNFDHLIIGMIVTLLMALLVARARTSAALVARAKYTLNVIPQSRSQ